MTIISCHCLQVSNRTTPTTVVCACTHLTSFASQVFVAPNTIDFSTVFNDFGNQLLRNYHVLITLGLILLLYIVLLVYLRRKDQQDIIKVNWQYRYNETQHSAYLLESTVLHSHRPHTSSLLYNTCNDQLFCRALGIRNTITSTSCMYLSTTDAHQFTCKGLVAPPL